MSIPAAVFKAECLKLMDEVARTGQPVVITKHGKPVAQLAPVAAEPKSLFGYMKNTVTISAKSSRRLMSWSADVGRGGSFLRGQEKATHTPRRPEEMSALLLDTHVWLWFAEGVPERLRPASIRKLDEARKGDGLVISSISVWEIGMHAARGRIQLAVPLRDWVDRALGVPGIRLAPLDAAVAAESTLLPGEPQGDPADRFLIATAERMDSCLRRVTSGSWNTRSRGPLRVARM